MSSCFYMNGRWLEKTWGMKKEIFVPPRKEFSCRNMSSCVNNIHVSQSFITPTRYPSPLTTKSPVVGLFDKYRSNKSLLKTIIFFDSEKSAKVSTFRLDIFKECLKICKFPNALSRISVIDRYSKSGVPPPAFFVKIILHAESKDCESITLLEIVGATLIVQFAFSNLSEILSQFKPIDDACEMA